MADDTPTVTTSTTREPTVALVPGSVRRESVHRRLADAIARGLRERGVVTDVVDLGRFPMPIYHGDDEARSGPPPAAVELHDLVAASDGLILLSPEYNGGPSALLKNAIDWVTRVDRAALRRPLVGLASASPGSRGARQVLEVMRSIGEHMRLSLVADEFSLPHAGDALATDDLGWFVARSPDRERLDAWLDGYAARLREHVAASAGDGGGAAGR